MQWKTNLSSTTQPISSIVIATTNSLMQCGSTVNIAFVILQPKITIIYNIQHGSKNEGKWKELILHQTKQWLIILSRLPEKKE